MAQNETHIYCAEPIGDQEIPEITLHITETIPEIELPSAWNEPNNIFTRQADLLEKVLYRTLPGGTYDHLLAAMLKRKASLYIHSYAALEQCDAT